MTDRDTASRSTDRDAHNRVPTSYTRGSGATRGKRRGYKSARRSAKVWISVWADVLVASNCEENRIR